MEVADNCPDILQMDQRWKYLVRRKNSVRLRQTCKIHYSLPSIMRVANSQPTELLTAGLLTNVWPLFGTVRWETRCNLKTCTSVQVTKRVPTREVSWIRNPTTTLAIHCQEMPMQMFAAFWKAVYLWRPAVYMTNFTLYQVRKKRDMPDWGLSDSQSTHQDQVDQPERCNESSKPHPWFVVLRADETHSNPEKENTKQVLHTELQCVNSSERLQMYMLWDSVGTCSGG